MRILITGGTVINPAGKTGNYNVLIEGDKIVDMLSWGASIDFDERIYAEGMIVAPGLVDTHVHFRDPGQTYKEDIVTGARAAIRGGFTTVVMMANTSPPIDNERTLRHALGKGKFETKIHVNACCSVTEDMRGERLTDMKALTEAGAVGFSDDGKPILSESLMREAMIKARELGVPISLHEEDPAYVETPGFNKGKASQYFEIGGASREAEIVMIKRDIELARETGAKVVIQHISTAEGVALVRQAKHDGVDIHAEATPHHFTLTEIDAIRYSTLAKMNPPVRTEDDRHAIREGLSEGVIDIIATDHAPHTMKEKMESITKAPSGIVGLETAVGLAFTELVHPGLLTYHDLIKLMSVNPARIYGLNAGVLKPGVVADVVVIDPYESWRVEANRFASKSSNSPFLGWTLHGKVKCTIASGEILHRG